jgi:ribosome-associated translation inhibitor RaiA
MNIFFQTRNMDVSQKLRDIMANRLYGLSKFLSTDAQVFVSVEKTRASQSGDDLFYVSLNIEDGSERYFTEEYADDVRNSFDQSYREIFRIIRDERGRSRNLARRAGARLKKLFRRKN